jgi:hypothetical protein
MYVECPWKTLVTELVTRTKYIFADKKRVLIISRQALMICLQQFHVPSPKQLYFSTWKKLTIEPFYNQLIITIIITTLLMKYIAKLRYWILTYLHWLLLWSTCFISSLISYHRPTLFCCNFKAQWLKMQPGPLIGFSFPFLSFQWCEILPIDCAGTWFSLVFMYTISWFWNADPLATTVQLLYIY